MLYLVAFLKNVPLNIVSTDILAKKYGRVNLANLKKNINKKWSYAQKFIKSLFVFNKKDSALLKRNLVNRNLR